MKLSEIRTHADSVRSQEASDRGLQEIRRQQLAAQVAQQDEARRAQDARR